MIMQIDKFMTEKQKQLVTDNYNLVHYVLKRYKNQIGENYDDYEQVSAISLCIAAMKFDESKGVSFSTFAVPYIDGYIKKYRMENMFPIKFSRGAFYRGEAEKTSFISLNQPSSDVDGSPEIGDLISSTQTLEDDVLLEIDFWTILQKKLTDKELDTLKLFIDGYSQREISEMKHCSHSLVSRRIIKARKVISDYMKK